jgi:Ca2+-binding EF-hand superfamily protein
MTFYKSFAYSHGWEAPIEADIKYLFNLIDTDRSGSVTLPEVSAYFDAAASKGQNVKLFARIAATITFERIDADRSGTISVEEFKTAVAKYAYAHQIQAPNQVALETAFNAAIKSGNTFNMNNFNNLVSNTLLGGASISAPENPSAPEKLRAILRSVLANSLFNQIDTDHSGKITLSEVIAFSGKLHAGGLAVPNQVELRKYFNQADTDHSGSISLPEFQAVISLALQSGAPLSVYVELAAGAAFNSLDTDHSGDVSIEEYRSGVKNYANKYNFAVPSDEVINASWRHSIGVQNKFTSEAFLKLIASQFGLEMSASANATSQTNLGLF